VIRNRTCVMTWAALWLFLGWMGVTACASDQVAVAWFTDADLEGAVRGAPPADMPLMVEGTNGTGVALDLAVAVESPVLTGEGGQISFWIKPRWDGNDGKRHQLLRIGDSNNNGLLVEKSARGFLRYVMASPEKVTASRCDVSHWRAGQWHQVTIAWFSRDGKPYGLPLFLDEHLPGRGGPEPVDGPVAAGNTFLDPNRMADARVWIGDETAEAVMDELIMRREMEEVYQDYYRTAPFTRIVIDPAPNYARSEGRVVVGQPKQFGLRAEIRGQLRQITDFTQRYGQWGEHDAKPLIRWKTSDEAVATVDANGLVTGAKVGHCTLTAAFRGLKASYDLEVTSAEQADLSVLYLSRLPRYRRDAAKSIPAVGDMVQTVAHLGNYGAEPIPAGTKIRLELIPDTNANFLPDMDERAIATQTKPLEATLAPFEKTEIKFDWKWVDEPTWICITADPQNEVPELCEVNNRRFHLNLARPTRIGLDPKLEKKFYDKRAMNLVGSFCYYDYAQAQFELLDGMLRDAVYPTTSPAGVQDSHYIDEVFATAGPGDEGWDIYEGQKDYYQAAHVHLETILMAQNSGAIHEGGHNALKLPDLYAYNVAAILLRDETGCLYSDTELLPQSEILGPAACGPYYSSLMNYCHLWLHPANAGKIHYFRGYRAEERFWGAQCRLLPTRRNLLAVSDLNDGPLANAAVYVYHVTHVDTERYLVDRPKFIGHTDDGGQFVFPAQTHGDWDDPRTDRVDGSIPVWNPFGQSPLLLDRMRDVPFTPNVWETEGILLVKLVSRGQTEFHWLTDLDFQEAFFSGTGAEGRIAVATSLRSSPTPAPLVASRIPDAIRQENQRPVAALKASASIVPGQEVVFDASDSYDPEGQSIAYYSWRFPEGIKPRGDTTNWRLSGVARVTVTLPDTIDGLECKLRVYDGLRWSEETVLPLDGAEGATDN